MVRHPSSPGGRDTPSPHAVARAGRLDTSAHAALSGDGEAAWLRLKQHLEWCDHFALGFIFSAHPLVVDVLRERLADIYRARVTRLQVFDPAGSDDLLARVLPALLDPPGHVKALAAPYWLDLSRQDGREWPQARLAFLARLNEQREPLRRSLGRPLVLVLPAAERERIRTLVPDLWAIRHFSLQTGNWLAAPETPRPKEITERPARFPLSDYEVSLVREWERLKQQGSRDRGMLPAGGRAFDAYLHRGHLDEAGALAGQLVEIARRRMAELGETPEALRDVSVSLNNVGRTAQALGQWEEARRVYTESLEIRQRLLAQVGETPEALRDVSVSLDNVGRTAQALGQWEEARRVYEDGLAVAAPLSAALPDHPEYASLADHFRQRLYDVARTGRPEVRAPSESG